MITALNTRREYKLVQDIEKNLQKSPPISAPVAREQTVTVELPPENEKEILSKLIDLNKTFSGLIMHVRSGLDQRNESNPKLLVNLTRWLETYMNWNDKLTNASLDETFKIIHPHYDFIDCALIVDMSEVFLEDYEFGKHKLNIVSELQKYKDEADKLRASAKVKHLNEALEAIYEEHIPDVSNMPTILIKLHNSWQASSINGLSLLIHKLLPNRQQQSLMKYITIKLGCVIVKYAVYGYAADSLMEHAGGKLQFMRHIGIFSLHINDHAVLQEDENMNFTFELALHEAVTAGHNEAVELLLQLETVNIDHTNEEGKTALMLACERGHEDIVHSLLSAGANVNLQDNNGWTALMRASKHNHISIINVLLQANANPHLKTTRGSNALMIASGNGNYEVVELLISIGVDYKYQREDGWNAFMVACQNGHTQIVELLLKEKVDPNVQLQHHGWNAFMLACLNGHTQIVELLLKEQVDPNVQNEYGENAFMLAFQNGHTQIVELLLKEQVDPNVQRMLDGGNAFTLACKNGHTKIVELLLKEQVDPNVQNGYGESAFMLACQNGHTQIVELLLKEKVDPNVQIIFGGGNAFMLACKNGHTKIVELLLKEQVDPNVQNGYGENAFMLACQNGHTQIVELLLKEQVDPNVQKEDGWNAFMLACQNGHTQIVELLLKEQVDPNVQDKDGWNAFMLACLNGRTQIVELLLKKQVNPNVQNKNGHTALMVASLTEFYKVVRLLLEWKADSDIKSDKKISDRLYHHYMKYKVNTPDSGYSSAPCSPQQQCPFVVDPMYY